MRPHAEGLRRIDAEMTQALQGTREAQALTL
jgi:hypothetical protein